MKTYSCDLCKSQIASDGDHNILTTTQGTALANAQTPLRAGGLDLCSACALAFVNWVLAAVGKGKGES